MISGASGSSAVPDRPTDRPTDRQTDRSEIGPYLRGLPATGRIPATNPASPGPLRG
jgi:hypothetical protein